LLSSRLLVIPEDNLLSADAELESAHKWQYKNVATAMKFNHHDPIDEAKFFLFVGDNWNLKAFISLVTDDFKYDYVAPASVLLLETYEEESVNATG
jgi:hypothetical protein